MYAGWGVNLGKTERIEEEIKMSEVKRLQHREIHSNVYSEANCPLKDCYTSV